MEINLKSEDLNRAVEQYVRSMVTVAEGMSVTTTFKAGRNGNGFTAAVSIAPTETATEVAETAPEEPKAEEVVETSAETTEAPVEEPESSGEPAPVAGQSDSIFGNG